MDKNEVYNFIALKLQESNQTFSNKAEVLSGLVQSLQEEVRSVRTQKNDSLLAIEDIKTLVDQRDRVFRDSLHENAQ